MLYIEFDNEFDSEDEMFDALRSVVSRLIIDPETGEIMGLLGDEDMDSDITVKVPDHIVDWAKKEPQ